MTELEFTDGKRKARTKHYKIQVETTETGHTRHYAVPQFTDADGQAWKRLVSKDFARHHGQEGE